ncbi:GntR family transcriptional regulator [Actinoplanes sp. CA-054009]
MTAAERAYAYTKEKILKGRLAAGDRLSEGQICAELGLSRTPVHEAFLRLEAERLIQLSSRQGATISPIPLSEAADVLEMRGVIERTAAARIAARRIDLGDALDKPLRRQREAMDGGDVGAFVEADIDFHTAIVALAGNPIAAHFYELLRDRQLRLAYAVLIRTDVAPAESFADHRELADCLRRHDADGYGLVLDRHLARHQGLL